MVSNCNKFHKIVSGDTCAVLASSNGISLDDFYSWNPAVGSSCSTLIIDYYVCVGVIGQSVPPTTTPTNGITTPTPVQTGIVGNCNSFHLVVSGDTCPDIASHNGISLDNFYSWNPAVGSDCTRLLVGDYVCVGIIGGTTVKPTSTSSKPGNGISTPNPIQTGMVGNCNQFHLVVSGDSCPAIAASSNIALSDFYAWNPAVKTDCTLLLVGDYVCVGIVGGTTTKPTSTISTTSKPGNGISTPNPIQTGMVGNCNKFHLVVSGDSCAAIATSNNIALSDFYTWNPAVKTDCTLLLVGDYVCIGIVGGTTIKPTSTTSTTSKPGNGISTPNPIQTGMVGNCNKFHLVVSGDSCAAIATSNNIALADFYTWNPAVKTDCTSLLLGDYVCVGIVGGTTIKPTSTTTKPGNGISTPTPTQTGMVSNCNTFYLVKTGDSCAAIATSKGISLDNFYKWNPAIKTDCSGLWVSYYVCVNIVGGTTSTTLKTTKTTSGNGVATPTPTQTGMVKNCKTFHKGEAF